MYQNNALVFEFWCLSYSFTLCKIKYVFIKLHIQIPPTGYLSLILHSTSVATQVAAQYRWGYYEGTLTLL